MSRKIKIDWAIAVMGALAVVVLVVLLFRRPPPPVASVEVVPTKRSVVLVNAKDKSVSDESILLDPTALFLPTRWNTSQREIKPTEPGGIFQGYDTPKHSFSENDLKLSLPTAIVVPTGAAEAVMAEAATSPLRGFGISDQAVAIPQLRGGHVEVVSAATGRSVWSETIPVGPAASGPWQPVEYVAAVDAAGLIGPLAVTTRSGSEEVDGFFSNYLIKTSRLGARLTPGFYRIYVGP